MHYGNGWRQQRKFAHRGMSPEAVKKYFGFQEDAATVLLKSLVEAPKDFLTHLRL